MPRPPRRSSPLVLALAAVVVASGAGCANAGKREAASLVGAVDAYRHAQPGPSKESRGKAVADVPCSDAKVCEAKLACVAAIDPTIRAIALKDEVAARVADLEKGVLAKGSPEALQLPAKLDEAERLLTDGRAKMAACDARLTDLHVDFGV